MDKLESIVLVIALISLVSMAVTYGLLNDPIGEGRAIDCQRLDYKYGVTSYTNWSQEYQYSWGGCRARPIKSSFLDWVSYPYEEVRDGG